MVLVRNGADRPAFFKLAWIRFRQKAGKNGPKSGHLKTKINFLKLKFKIPKRLDIE